MFRLAALLFVILICNNTSAQNTVKGRVNFFSRDTVTYLSNASVYNKASGKMVLSDQNGNYTINANAGDTVIFSHVDFINDTVNVTQQFFISGYDPALILKDEYLGEVMVRSAYSKDSLERREQYQKVFEKPAGITGGNTPQAGVGITLSPVSYFSKKASQNRKFKKQLLKQERESYIDYVFSAGRVVHLTGLNGEQLRDFMYRYRPSYELCRKLKYEEMTIYINDKFLEYKKQHTKNSAKK